MINKRQRRWCSKYCKDGIENIPGYQEALTSTEKYECHHLKESTFTKKELEDMNLYWNRPADELIFLRADIHKSMHARSRVVTDETREKMSNSSMGRKGKLRSEFGGKFFEHYGIHFSENKTLYRTEKSYYKIHGKCRWE